MTVVGAMDSHLQPQSANFGYLSTSFAGLWFQRMCIASVNGFNRILEAFSNEHHLPKDSAWRD